MKQQCMQRSMADPSPPTGSPETSSFQMALAISPQYSQQQRNSPQFRLAHLRAMQQLSMQSAPPVRPASQRETEAPSSSLETSLLKDWSMLIHLWTAIKQSLYMNWLKLSIFPLRQWYHFLCRMDSNSYQRNLEIHTQLQHRRSLLQLLELKRRARHLAKNSSKKAE